MTPGSRQRIVAGLFIAATLLSFGATAQPEEPNPLGLSIVQGAQNAIAPGNLPTSLVIAFLITILSLAPAILVMTTSFTRIIVVLGFLRQALATQQTPPNQVLIGLALILTFFIMAPTYQRVNSEAIQPYVNGQFESPAQALDAALAPVREFMFKQTDPQDLRLFLEIGHVGRPDTPDDVPTHVLLPAFVLSEMATAFKMGFVIYIPFLIIDMVVASTLMAMGMMMLPPIFVSLPFKIIMFVLADGWRLVIGTLVRSFQ